MNPDSISKIAEGFGLTIERANTTGVDNEYRVYKGVNSIFTGNEDAVRTFLSTYEKERPPMFEGSIYGYKE